MAGIGLAWTYMVNLAIDAERAKLDEALAALDDGNYEQARLLVRHVLGSGALPRERVRHAAVRAGRRQNLRCRRRRRSRAAPHAISRCLALPDARPVPTACPPEREKQGLLLLGQEPARNARDRRRASKSCTLGSRSQAARRRRSSTSPSTACSPKPTRCCPSPTTSSPCSICGRARRQGADARATGRRPAA